MIAREKQHPRSYEIFDGILKRGDAKEIARLVGLTPQSIRNYCRAPETTEDFNATGRYNPLDFIRTLIHMIRDDDGSPARAYPLGNYIARMLCGVFIPLPQAQKGGVYSEATKHIANTLKEVMEFIEKLRKSCFEETPGKISEKELSDLEKESGEAIRAIIEAMEFVREQAKNGKD